MGISGKGVTTSLTLSTKNTNEKKLRTDITEITNQGFNELLNNFKDLPYLG